jgi:eukaryotic-like serine/threonine-protein kinase
VSAATQTGRVIAGKYRLEHPLGTGGMGTVIAATHLGLGRKVALKFMRPGVLDDAEATGRFLREARAAATLRSEHVAQVMDVEVDNEDGTPYIVMEYLEGSDLGSILKSKGAPPVVSAVDYVLQASEGLAEAHAKGIVHRDLKPANLFLTRRPDGTPLVKLLDFGISKLNEATQSGSFRLTRPRATVGSPQYMSPEQMIASPDVDARADIWALGVILYELLAGAPPFAAPTFVELCLEVTNKPHRPLAARVPGLAPGLVAVVNRCLQKSPGARFPHLGAMASALVPHAGTGADLAAVRIARTLGIKGAGDVEAPARPARGRGRRAVAIVLTAGAALAAVVAGGWLAGRPRAVVDTERAASPAAVAPPPSQQPPAPPAPPTPAATAPDPAADPGPVPATPTRTAVPATRAPAPVATQAAPKDPTRPPPRKSAGAIARRRPPAVLPAQVPADPPAPPVERPALEAGATPTKRGPVVTDL